jgi:hypothetical protein
MSSKTDDYRIGEYSIYYFTHPMLYGKWEIFKGSEEKFIARANSKKDNIRV